MQKDELSAWQERRPKRTEKQRAEIAQKYAAHLPQASEYFIAEEDIKAMKAAFIRRFDENLPRTETLFSVAAIGYRMALRALAGGE